MKLEIPKNHPRYLSLTLRERIFEGYERKVVAGAGMIAHGRGEAYDYLLGEATPPFAARAVRAAAAAILLAKHPVISVNGNVAALCPEELVALSRESGAPLEVNLFYRTEEREHAVAAALSDAGAGQVLGVGADASGVIPELGSERRRVDPRGIEQADLVFVPLEDGDRTEALVRMGKTVLTVDLNPLSRTSQRATITIVDNVVRVLPALTEALLLLRGQSADDLEALLKGFDNQQALSESLLFIAERLHSLADLSRK
ncbi:MAG TPA: phosphopantothenate/pantothenate synthetase [Spirochaetia bacterium]|nr:phosphopantothenate/pantothenate synthetase [Spirochaetia bacterium]